MNNCTLIIISFNSYETISHCLEPLLNNNVQFPAIIVDNASTDGSVQKLKEKIPQCDFVVLGKNLGYGRAANIALEKTKTPYALLVNPDIKISNRQVMDLLKKTKNFPQAAIFAPGTHLKHRQFGDKPVEQKEVSGSCMLFDMEKLRKVGFFDENIFLFSEETDLCMRTVNAGFKIMLFPDIDVEHQGGSSSGSSDDIRYLKSWHFGWSRSYYYQKHSLDTGKKSLNRRLLQYRWKRLSARGNYRKVKFRGICDGVAAFRRGDGAFTENDRPQMHPASSKNPYVRKK